MPIFPLKFASLGVLMEYEDIDYSQAEIIENVILCESGGNPNAWNKKDPNGGSFGILQFQLSTFKSFCVDKYGLENDIWNAEVQIVCAKKMLDEGLGRNWSCWRKLQ